MKGDREATHGRRPDLVIFDCDGVLVDSESIVAGVLAEQLRQLGVEITDAECEREFAGLTQDRATDRVVALLGTSASVGWFNSLTRSVDEALRARVRPVPGVLDVIRLLEFPFCVASNGRAEKVALTLRTSGLAGYFEDRIFTAADVMRGKPAPDVFLLAAERLGADPRRCVVVEDSESGIAAARAAGMRVLGFVPARDRTLDGADALFSSMADLPRMLFLPTN
ncbi:HAD family hydrolase [Micromonospora sp. ALFpr18c]|uniref:HAD family hydrolase n=1 Tax=Micromonospora sp. ALFpr18c TaxID=1458665 RepID=UPI00124BA416|nr:HAD family hydrolase [Micromonospora sp. ALFpr18c]KAB1934753.1 HAD family hydrolase [Micromonospora sp. ALFpr18c]